MKIVKDFTRNFWRRLGISLILLLPFSWLTNFLLRKVLLIAFFLCKDCVDFLISPCWIIPAGWYATEYDVDLLFTCGRRMLVNLIILFILLVIVDELMINKAKKRGL